MDAKMASTVTEAGAYPTWDFVCSSGIVPYIEGDEESDQRAELACFLQKGLLPQLPTLGVDWVAFFLKELSFGDLDGEIRQMLSDSGDTSHVVTYSANDDKLVLTLNRSR